MTGKSRTIFTIVMTVVGILLVIGLIAWVSNLFSKKITFGVTIDGILYESNADGLVLEKNTTVFVSSPSGDYDVSINTRATNKDFEFYIGKESYLWSDTVYRDFTSGFNVTLGDGEFVIMYENIVSVFSDALGYPAKNIIVPDIPTDEDLFVLIVSADEQQIHLGFTLSDLLGNADVSDITLDKTEIIF